MFLIFRDFVHWHQWLVNMVPDCKTFSNLVHATTLINMYRLLFNIDLLYFFFFFSLHQIVCLLAKHSVVSSLSLSLSLSIYIYIYIYICNLYIELVTVHTMMNNIESKKENKRKLRY